MLNLHFLLGGGVEIGESRLLGTDTSELWRWNDEFLRALSGRGIVLVDDSVNAVQELLVKKAVSAHVSVQPWSLRFLTWLGGLFKSISLKFE